MAHRLQALKGCACCFAGSFPAGRLCCVEPLGSHQQSTTAARVTQSDLSDNGIDMISDISTPRHTIKVPLSTRQDVTKAREWAKSAEMQGRPILADFKFEFRALYDTADTITTIQTIRMEITSSVQQILDDFTSRCGDSASGVGIIAQFLTSIPRNTVGVLQFMVPRSKSLLSLGYPECRYFQFFRELALRKKGREWDAADLEGIIEFLEDFRSR